MNKKRKRILFISVADDIGGAELITEKLIIKIQQKHDVLIACPPGNYLSRLQTNSIPVQPFSSLSRLHRDSQNRNLITLLSIVISRSLVLGFAISTLIIKNKIDIIHAINHNAASRCILSLLIVRSIGFFFGRKPKWIYTRHDAKQVHRIDSIPDHLCLILFNRCICVSEAVRNLYSSLWYNKTECIYNGCDLEMFYADPVKRFRVRNDFSVSEDSLCIGIVGRISKSKGQLFLLNAYLNVQEKVKHKKKLYLFFIGQVNEEDYEYNDILQGIIANNKFIGQIIYTGYRSDMDVLYNGMDILVNASSKKISESFGLTIVEAMACNCVVIAPCMGGIPEIISNNDNGFLFCPDDVNSLTEVLFKVVGQWNQMNKIKDAALKITKSRFDLNKMVENYDKLYQ